MTPSEPGRHTEDDGRIITHWPPEGRFSALWDQFCAAFPQDQERHDLLDLLLLWRDANSTLVAFTNDEGEWIDCDPGPIEDWLGGA